MFFFFILRIKLEKDVNLFSTNKKLETIFTLKTQILLILFLSIDTLKLLSETLDQKFNAKVEKNEIKVNL